MTVKPIKRTPLPRVAVASAVLLASLGVPGCTDAPVKPTPVKYNIYVNHSQNEVIYIVDADSLTIIDSIPDVPLAWDIESSPDGRWLYVQLAYDRQGSASVVKYDLCTKELVATTEGSYLDLRLLDEGRIIMRGTPRCLDSQRPAQLLRSEDLGIVAEYGDSLCRYSGASSGAWIAAALGNESERMRSVDVIEDSINGLFRPRTKAGLPLYVNSAYLHPNRKWVWLTGRAPDWSKWAVVGDLESDSCLFDLSLASLVGALAISDDGRWGVATDPSRPGAYGEPTRINIIDFETLESRFIQNLSTSPVQAKFLPGTDIVVIAREYRDTFTGGTIAIQLIAAGAGQSLKYATLDVNKGRIGGIGVGVRYEN